MIRCLINISLSIPSAGGQRGTVRRRYTARILSALPVQVDRRQRLLVGGVRRPLEGAQPLVRARREAVLGRGLLGDLLGCGRHHRVVDPVGDVAVLDGAGAVIEQGRG